MIKKHSLNNWNEVEYYFNKFAKENTVVPPGDPRWSEAWETAQSGSSVDLSEVAKEAQEAAANVGGVEKVRDRKSTRLNSSHVSESRMPSSA